MKYRLELILILGLLMTGCASDEAASVKGEIFDVNQDEETLVVYVEDTLTEREKNTSDFDEKDKNIEAFLVQTGEGTVVKGEVDSFNDLKREQKIKITIQEDYKKELVTMDALFHNHEKLPVYNSEKLKVIPYTKQELVEDMTVDEGSYGLYIYHPKPNEDGGYSPAELNEKVPFHRTAMINSVSKVKNTKELLGLYEHSPTYIITDDKGIVFKTNKKKELGDFVDTLTKRETE